MCNKEIDKAQKDEGLSEDNAYGAKDTVQELLKKFEKQIESFWKHWLSIPKLQIVTIKTANPIEAIDIIGADGIVAKTTNSVVNPTYYELVEQAFNSEVIGSRIYAVRAMRNIHGFLEGQEKENTIIAFSERIKDEDPVVSWDTTLALQKLIFEAP